VDEKAFSLIPIYLSIVIESSFFFTTTTTTTATATTTCFDVLILS